LRNNTKIGIYWVYWEFERITEEKDKKKVCGLKKIDKKGLKRTFTSLRKSALALSLVGLSTPFNKP
jgi:hypothetical protein